MKHDNAHFTLFVSERSPDAKYRCARPLPIGEYTHHTYNLQSVFMPVALLLLIVLLMVLLSLSMQSRKTINCINYYHFGHRHTRCKLLLFTFKWRMCVEQCVLSTTTSSTNKCKMNAIKQWLNSNIIYKCDALDKVDQAQNSHIQYTFPSCFISTECFTFCWFGCVWLSVRSHLMPTHHLPSSSFSL